MAGGGRIEALLAQVEVFADAAFETRPADGHQVAVLAHDPRVSCRQTRLAHIFKPHNIC